MPVLLVESEEAAAEDTAVGAARIGVVQVVEHGIAIRIILQAQVELIGPFRRFRGQEVLLLGGQRVALPDGALALLVVRLGEAADVLEGLGRVVVHQGVRIVGVAAEARESPLVHISIGVAEGLVHHLHEGLPDDARGSGPGGREFEPHHQIGVRSGIGEVALLIADCAAPRGTGCGQQGEKPR